MLKLILFITFSLQILTVSAFAGGDAPAAPLPDQLDEVVWSEERSTVYVHTYGDRAKEMFELIAGKAPQAIWVDDNPQQSSAPAEERRYTRLEGNYGIGARCLKFHMANGSFRYKCSFLD